MVDAFGLGVVAATVVKEVENLEVDPAVHSPCLQVFPPGHPSAVPSKQPFTQAFLPCCRFTVSLTQIWSVLQPSQPEQAHLDPFGHPFLLVHFWPPGGLDVLCPAGPVAVVAADANSVFLMVALTATVVLDAFFAVDALRIGVVVGLSLWQYPSASQEAPGGQ